MGHKKKAGTLARTFRKVARDKKTGKFTATVQEVAYYNMCLTEAIFELLADKGIVTGSEVMDRISKLKRETEIQSTLVH